jgi:two-component system OmpR family response regulator/two-component system response regulator QseB
MHILLAKDDTLLGDGLRAGLRQLGFQVDWVQDGAAAARELRVTPPYAAAVLDLGLPKQDGLAVLDLGLPKQDGLAVLDEVRRAGVKVPVLILTARDAIPDRIQGLDLGADDYVVKPVDLYELAARLVRKSGAPVSLSPREFDLLHALMLNPDKVLSREQLEQYLYSWCQEVEDSGPGMEPAALSRLGERFFGVPGNGASGSGLGWSIAQRIAALHGLTLQAQPSAQLGGLAVTVSGPLRSAPGRDDPP